MYSKSVVNKTLKTCIPLTAFPPFSLNERICINRVICAWIVLLNWAKFVCMRPYNMLNKMIFDYGSLSVKKVLTSHRYG